jgi:peptidoglycan-associated lipoprotein
MKKNRISVIMIMVATLVCFLWVAGCAKKAVQQSEGPAPVAEKAVEKAPGEKPVAKAPTPTEGAVKERAAEAVGPKVADLADIRFDFDKSTLRSGDREVLKGHADWLMKNKNATVLIEGNCDERGTTEYNLALGERRAAEAMKYLVSLGIGKERIKTISYGEERPLDPGHNEEAWAKNRRDHFVITLK